MAEPAPRKYQKTQADYARLYSKSLATIKRWWKRGLPLDDADAMGEHLSPRGRRQPELDADFESPSIRLPLTGEDVDAAAAVAAVNAAAAALESPVRLEESFLTGTGFLVEIERLRKAAQERAGAYFTAIASRQGSDKIKNRLGEWVSVLEALRKLEKDAPGIRKANDLTVDVAEVEAIWSTKTAAFRAAANNLPGRAAGKLTGRRHNYDDIVAVLEEEISDLFRALVDEAETDDEAENPEPLATEA